MSTVKVSGLGKDYAAVPALANVSIDFVEAAVTAIIGRSGSGKSTLLKMINGLSRPDRGRVEVFGRAVDYSALPGLRRQIGYLVQGSGLFSHMSVRDNICLLAELEDWPEPEQQRRFLELLDMVQLEANMADRYPHQLSGGQQQWVALCRAMMLNSPPLLLDEPFLAKAQRIDVVTNQHVLGLLVVLQNGVVALPACPESCNRQKRHGRGAGMAAVHPHPAGLDAAARAEGPVGIVAPHTGAQAVLDGTWMSSSSVQCREQLLTVRCRRTSRPAAASTERLCVV